MRTTLALLALALLAGCRVATAPTLEPQIMRYGAPGAPTWLRHQYSANDRFPNLADLTYHRVGDQIELVARFTGEPAPIGDLWSGGISLGVETQYPFDSDQALSVFVNYRRVGGFQPPIAYRQSHDGRFETAPAQAFMRGNDLVMTCDASLLDFQPVAIVGSFLAHQECNPNGQCSLESLFARELGPRAPVAAVDR
jgi:hypothetical protein